MNLKRLQNRWAASLATKVETCAALLRQRRPLNEPEVHDLRVALRRARMLADVGARTLGRTRTRRFRKAARTMLDALDRLRDCDVALDWLQQAGAPAATMNLLKRRRTRLWKMAQRQFKPQAMELGEIPAGEKPAAKKMAARLDDHLAAVTRQALKTVQRAPEIPIAELHKLRRVVRRWRYLRELQLAPREIRRDRRLKTLIRVQESLGALQNDDVILAQLKSMGRVKKLPQLQAGLRSQFTHHHREALQQITELPGLL